MVSRCPPPAHATTGTPADIAWSTASPSGSAGAEAMRIPALRNSSATLSAHPVNVTPASASDATQRSSVRRSAPSPTTRNDHPSSASREACHERSAVSESFSGSRRWRTRTRRLALRHRHGNSGTPETTTALGGRSMCRATNSLIAISRARRAAIHGAAMRPRRLAPRAAAKCRVLTTRAR